MLLHLALRLQHHKLNPLTRPTVRIPSFSEKKAHLYVPYPMAIYHLTAKIVSREKGQSAVAYAAYRAGDHLYDERLGVTWNYTRKDGVTHTEILAPEGAPTWIVSFRQARVKG